MAAHISCAQIDNSFGPYAQYCRGGFDFTLLFEETILTIAPLALLLLVTPFRLRYLFNREKKVVDGPLLHIKIAALAAFSALHLILLILWARSDAIRTSTSIPANVITVVGAVTSCLLSYAEHTRTVTPSTLLNAYFLFTLLFDTARARTLWLREQDQYNETIAIAFSATVGLKSIILLLEAVGKRWILYPLYKAYPPEATSGIFNRSFFWWLNSLFRAGFSKLLFVNDLFVLDKHLVSERIHTRMRAAWDKVEKKSPNSLLFIAFRTLKWPLLSVIFPRLCLIGFNYSQPFLISRAMSLTTQPIDEVTNNDGYGLIGAYFIVYVGIAISMGQYQHRTYRAITMVRGGLVSMLYEKVADLNIQDVDPASSMTLMSADIERIVQGWQTMHDIWANAIEIALAIFLLERELGVACVVPIAVSILSLGGSILAMNFVVSRQAAWLEAIERRISATSAMLGSMKGIKMSGLRQTLMTNLQNLRVEELDISKKFRRLLIWNMGFAYVTQVFAPIITFAVFAIISRETDGVTLDVNRIFTSLSLFSLLSEPLASVIMSLVTFLGSIGCFVRIQEFLDKTPRQDLRLKSSYIQGEFSQSTKTLEGSGQTSVVSDNKSELSGLPAVKSRLSFPFKDAFVPTPSEDAIIVSNGNFGWDSNKEPLLKSVTFCIPREKLTMLIGPVGCGKSTLLKALLGEVPTMGGTVQVASTNIAYCDQSPWHMNETIQQSILATLDLDETWYNSVLRACALQEDLGQLPRGDQTVVGSKGVALSGGQSQRIALARAVYAQKDIVILDDVLSGIDASTENHIFHNLFGEDGLLRRLRSSIIIASSSPKRLPYCDHIITLDAEGRISEQGTFNDLNKTGGYVSSFSLPAADWSSKPEPALHDRLSSVIRPSAEGETSEMIEAEANRRTGDISIYLYYIGSIGWVPTIIFIVAITGFVFCTTFPQIWLKWWATANIEAPNERLGYYLGIYAMLGVLAIMCLVVGCWQMIITMVPKSGVSFHWTLLKTVLSAPLSFFSSIDTGVTLNRFSQDLQLIDMELPIAALNTFTTFVLCIAQMVLIGVASKWAAIAFPAVLITLYMVQKYYLRTSRQLRFMDLEAKAPLYSQFEEALNGLATIRAFGWQNALEEKNRKLLDRSQRPFYLLFSVQRWLTLVLDLVVAAIAVLLIIIVVMTRGTMTAGFVGVALLNVITFSQSIKLLVTFWATLETHIGAIARIKVFHENAMSEDKDTENTMPPPTWPSSEGGIEFHSISAEYKSGEPVLREVSLSIAPGEKIGVCGRTGSGKSSLILSLFRMIELSSGKITVDGVDISTIPRQEIRSRITGVAQDAFLLRGTTRANVDPTGFLSDGAIINALTSVHLWSVIDEKGGLDTDVDELHLSHGQKQLLCLARALLRPSTILILDEATSNIDAKTDDIMQRVIREKFSGHTVIAVAHKLDTILDFDKVALLDSGELVEFDDPYTLLSSDSAFCKLYASTMADNDDDGFVAEEITLTSAQTPSGISGRTSRS